MISPFIRIAVLALSFLAVTAEAAFAEVSELRVSQQFGLSYLPLIHLRAHGLIEKQAAARGIPNLRVTYTQFSGGAAVNDALLSGSIDIGAGGIAPLLTIWDKTRGNLDVRAIAGLDRTVLHLNTNRPNIRTIADFTDKDRIAVPSVKVSIQSVLLQIAAEQAFGPGHQEDLDRLTVSLKHPDAHALLLSGDGSLTAHFAQPPYGTMQLTNPTIHTVLTSATILGGPATLNVLYATAKFREENPTVVAALIAALDEADRAIAADPAAAARLYVESEKPAGIGADLVEAFLSRPELSGYSVLPSGTERIAAFMARTQAIKNKPVSWNDYFFPGIDGAGN